MPIRNILGRLLDSNQRELKKLEPLVTSINDLEKEYKELSDENLKAKTAEFKLRIERGETLNDLLSEAFAAVREASRRTIGLRHFDVQLMAGIAFHQGKIAEQKTGEGKTLSATSALYLNALTERGTHLVTVNDYLARRDCGWMGPIYQALGLSTSVIYAGEGQLPASIFDPEFEEAAQTDERLRHLRPVSRKEAYQADITYGTNNEFGFDYLRDNMAQGQEFQVQREHHFAIVDEVDSILIDEARTPLIISAPDTEPTSKYYDFANLVNQLSSDTDYEIDEKHRTANLTDRGIKKIEKRLNVDNLYEKDFQTIHHIEQALKARTLFHRDKEYVIKDDQIIIVDEHTGRLMYGRRYSEGLHQAIEAKENVKIQQESRTLATISLQNYFRMYEKLAGMTGTAATEAEEFKKIYNLEVIVVPTNEPMVRKDLSDIVYKTLRAKYGAVVAEVKEAYERGQPVLLGTRSIDNNEAISEYLKRKKIPHQVLNAKQHEKEAQIIANAGKVGAVTVATNMAGRGVDIVLGGAPPDLPAEASAKVGDDSYKKAIEKWRNEHEKVVKLGGLYVVGTERHESRRIDNQLRGRSGRQGDPGLSRFFVSLDDDIMRIFGGEQVQKLMTTLKIPEDQPIESGMVSRAIEQAQVKVEGFYFDARKQVVEYDDVMNKQREIFYKRRNKILEESQEPSSAESKERILKILDEEIENLVALRAPEGISEKELDAILKEFMTIIPFDSNSQKSLKEKLATVQTPDQLTGKLKEVVQGTYSQREKQITSQLMRQVEKFTLLSASDRLWMDHLDSIDELREGIGLRGDKQTALAIYKKEAFGMFERLIAQVDYEVARTIFRIQIRPAVPIAPTDVVAEKPQAEEPTQPIGDGEAKPKEERKTVKEKKGEAKDFAAAFASTGVPTAGMTTNRGQTKVQSVRKTKKIGRNDPCWCGSGKKWKKCHYPEIQ
jgi:preprotein translocase subunit SecA